MTSRILPIEEWPRLDDTSARDIWRNLNSDRVDVLVVEDETGAIIGQAIIMEAVHAECFEIDPKHRGNSAVARRLWEAASECIIKKGAKGMWASAVDEPMIGILQNHGKAVPEAQHFILPVMEKKWHQ